MATLLRYQARYEAMLADRMAEFERLRPEPQAAEGFSQDQPTGTENTTEAGQTTVAPSYSSSPGGSGNGMSQIQASIQQITSELHRLRLASEAITSARHSMHSHFQQQPERPPETLDNQPGRPAAMSDEEMTKKLDCQVCYQQLADIALLPCGHMVMCQWCADVVIPVKHTHLPIRPSKCPMCRKTVKQRFKIHMG
jgi:rubrerythrin